VGWVIRCSHFSLSTTTTNPSRRDLVRPPRESGGPRARAPLESLLPHAKAVAPTTTTKGESLPLSLLVSFLP
jgi:hypothetical protein